MRKTTQPHKRGLVYSLSLFFMLTVILSLGALWLMQSDRYMITVQTPSDAQVLSMRMNELKWLSLQSLGVNVNAGRNTTHRWVNISDAFPFAVTPTSSDRVYIRPLSQLVNGSAGTRGNWSSMSNVNVSKFNITGMITDGIVIRSTSGMTYTQDKNNSADISDFAYLYTGSNPQSFVVSIVCNAPVGASSVSYIPNPLITGANKTNRTISFTSIGAVNSTYSIGPNEFNPTTSQPLFQAKYNDSTPRWLQSIRVNWVAGTGLKIWSEANTTTLGNDKYDVSCRFNLSMTNTDNGAAQEEIYIPLEVDVRYYNATYSGNLSLVRE